MVVELLHFLDNVLSHFRRTKADCSELVHHVAYHLPLSLVQWLIPSELFEDRFGADKFLLLFLKFCQVEPKDTVYMRSTPSKNCKILTDKILYAPVLKLHFVAVPVDTHGTVFGHHNVLHEGFYSLIEQPR